MGFIKRTQKRRFEFKHFGVSHSLDHEEPGYERTEVFNPSTGQTAIKYVQKYDAIEGLVLDAEWYDRSDNGGTRYVGYLLTVDAGEEVITIDFPYPKSSYRTLTRHGANVDWTKPVKFSAWKSKTSNGKDACAVCFWQVRPDGKEATVKAAHTKENPNGCPPPKQTVKGFDFSDCEVWLKNRFDQVVLPKIKAAGAKHQAAQPAAKAAVAAATAATGDPNDPYGDYAPSDEYPPEWVDDSVPF
jgi:hypothetical protein